MSAGLPDFRRSLASPKARRAGFAYPLGDGRPREDTPAARALAAAEARIVKGNLSIPGDSRDEPDLRTHFMFTYACKFGSVAFLWDYGGGTSTAMLPGLLAFQLADRRGAPPAWFCRDGEASDTYFRIVAFVGPRVVTFGNSLATDKSAFYRWPRTNKLYWHARRLKEMPRYAEELRQSVVRWGSRYSRAGDLNCIRFSHYFIATDGAGQSVPERYPREVDALRSFAERVFSAERDHREAAARTIQSRLRVCMTDPNHPMCVRRLMWEYGEMVA
jgi:hypothetical protein